MRHAFRVGGTRDLAGVRNSVLKDWGLGFEVLLFYEHVNESKELLKTTGLGHGVLPLTWVQPRSLSMAEEAFKP